MAPAKRLSRGTPASAAKATPRRRQASDDEGEGTQRRRPQASQSQKGGGRRGRQEEEEEDDDDEEEVTATQARGFAALDATEKKKITSALARYVMCRHSEGNPIKHSEFAKFLREHHMFARVTPDMFTALNEALGRFGMELAELPAAEQSIAAALSQAATQKPKSGRKEEYVLVNKLENRGDCVRYSDLEQAQSSLLMLVLALIFMSPDGRMMEESLWAQLKPLGVDPLGKHHEQLGNVGDLVTKRFTKMKYIQSTEVNIDEGRTDFELRWGPRAKLEIAEEDVIRWICERLRADPEPYIKNHKAKLVQEKKSRERALRQATATQMEED